MLRLLLIAGVLIALVGAFLFLQPTSILEPRPESAGVSPDGKESGETATTTVTTTPSNRADSEATPSKIAEKPETPKPQILRPPPLPVIPRLSPPAPALLPTPVATTTIPLSATATTVPAAVVQPPPPALPQLNEQALLSAVVKVECPSEDRRGKYVGSGFVLPRGIVVTAAHVIKDSGSDDCQVIFPNKDRAPSHYLRGVTENREAVKRRHDEEGIDVAVIFLPALSAYPEGAAVFPNGYPSVPYPICEEARMLKDKLLHFGYPSNFLNQSYLSKLEGEAVVYADIQGIKEQLSEDQTFTFKTPVFGYTSDQSRIHPYMISRVPSFYGDSGGLAFNATQQCILGPHRGGTIGGGAGENFSVFPLLGWPDARRILP